MCLQIHTCSNKYLYIQGEEARIEAKQLVFIAFGQNWCDKEHHQMLQHLISSGEHAPSVFCMKAVVSQNSGVSLWMYPVLQCGAVWCS